MKIKLKKQITNTSGSATMFPSHRKPTATNFHFSLLSFLLLVFASVPLYSQISNMDMAVRLYQQKKYAEAGALFEAQINAGTREKEVYLAAIDCYLQLQNYDKSLVLTQKALTHFPGEYQLLVLLSNLYIQLERINDAISVLTQVVKTYKDSVQHKEKLSEMYLYKGSNQYTQGDINGAIDSYKSAISYNSRNKNARLNIMILLLRQKRFNEALEITKESYRLFPDEKVIRQGYFELLVATENYEEAEKVCEQILKSQPDDLQTNLNLALLYRYNRKVDQAIELYADLRKRFPRAKEVFLAEIQYLRLVASTDTIVARYKEYLQNSPNDLDMLTDLAEEYQYKKRFEEARSIYAEIIRKDLDRDAAIQIAESYFSEGKIDTAIIEFKNYIESGGKNKTAYNRIGELYVLQNEKENAKKYLKLGIERTEDPATICIQLGRLYYNEKNIDSAFACFELVKEKYTEYPEISFYSAEIYLQRGDSSRANFHFIRSVKNAIQLSQILQYEVINSATGENLMNRDSSETIKKKSAQLDLTKNLITTSLQKLKSLNTGEEFLKILTKMIRDVPAAAGLYLERGKFLAEAGMFKDAESDFNNALSLTSNEEVFRESGDFFDSIGKLEKAFECFYSAISLNKNEGYYYQRVIDLAIRLERLNKVCDYWLSLWEHDKRNTVFKEHLIEALHKAGRIDESAAIINYNPDE